MDGLFDLLIYSACFRVREKTWMQKIVKSFYFYHFGVTEENKKKELCT